uniref:Parvin, gamma n=1 Tax=Paramormyrops kingsleyae TaxID=1676925 RepID=A0A3B3QJL4_9TELE
MEEIRKNQLEEEGLGVAPGEKIIKLQPSSLQNPELQRLKQMLINWINITLKKEHIIVQSLEEDLFDGLVLHHLLERLSDVKLTVEEIAVTRAAQILKLKVVLEAVNQKLGIQDEASCKWSVKLIQAKDLLATLHLLVAMVKHFQPELELPSDLTVEVVMLEVTKMGIITEKGVECITESSASKADPENNLKEEDPIDELLKMEPQKVETVKKAILHFVNKNVEPLGLQVTEIDKQFADGVILLLLIGQVEGYFIPLYSFSLSPTSSFEMLQNVTLALDLLNSQTMQVPNVDPSGESKASVPLRSGHTGDDAGGQTAAVQKLRRETQSKASVPLRSGHTGDDAGGQTAAVQKLRRETQKKMSKDPKGPQRS